MHGGKPLLKVSKKKSPKAENGADIEGPQNTADNPTQS
jgi:hypothetical protein